MTLVGDEQPSRVGFVLLVTGSMVGAAGLAVITDGNVAACVALPVLLCLFGAVIHLPLRYSVATLLFVMLLFHNPGARPMQDTWQGPLYGPGALLFDNLRHLVGLSVLRFNGLEAALFLLVGIALVRRATRNPIDGGRTSAAPRPIVLGVLISFGSLLFWIGMGIARGGNFTQMLWQTRLLGWLAVMILLFTSVFRQPRDVALLGRIIIIASVLRCLEGLYFYVFVARARGTPMEYLTTHDDSVLFGLVVIMVVLALIECPSRKTLRLAVAVLPLTSLLIVLNTRRLAYVSLAICSLLLLFAVRRSIRRTLARTLIAVLPVLIIYAGVGWRSQARVFAPLRAFQSVLDDNNASNETRDVENFNLVYTLRQDPMVGSGFGHEYVEIIQTHSITEFMENYRYIAHNSVLWLWSLMGFVGLNLLWMFISIFVFLAVRCYRRASTLPFRVASLSAVAIAVMYFVQAFGDMGVMSWSVSALLACGVAVTACMTRELGVWPTR